ncbi:ABC transporter substrate-binding protein [Nocardioides aequoreus]|uniref:ABC transporter substrate-binding protein n=1 Tax=Nocardioides aequoreus TaxID=397278 RepID=UPI000560E00E|nr:ABC transporter substrate-binding protein [Nocardioides aequoreus]
MRRPRDLTTTATTATAVAAVLLLSACGAAETGAQREVPAGFAPVTVESCGAEVSFDTPPERMVLLKSAAVPYLHELGVMDRVVARAGQYPDDYYDEETRAELDGIELLTDRTDPSGHLQISRETVISQEPDLVLGAVDNLSRESLEAVGIPLLEEPALCPEGVDDPSFDDVGEQMRMYGEVFGEQDRAEAAAAAIEERVARLRQRAGDGSTTAAVLYPTVGGGTTYAYGTRSMAHPQLEAAGLDNVFGDVDERVFEVTLEELLGRDPDVVVLLHGDGAPADVEAALTDLPGADQLTAVREGEVMTQLFNFTEPPTPLSVDGLERLVDRFGERS